MRQKVSLFQNVKGIQRQDLEFWLFGKEIMVYIEMKLILGQKRKAGNKKKVLNTHIQNCSKDKREKERKEYKEGIAASKIIGNKGIIVNRKLYSLGVK